MLQNLKTGWCKGERPVWGYYRQFCSRSEEQFDYQHQVSVYSQRCWSSPKNTWCFFLSSPEYEYAMRFPVDAAPLAVQLSRVVVNGDLGTDQIMSFWFLPRVKLVIHGCLFSSVLLDKVVITSPMFLMRGTGCFFTSNVSCRVLH